MFQKYKGFLINIFIKVFIRTGVTYIPCDMIDDHTTGLKKQVQTVKYFSLVSPGTVAGL